jgi:hypothetical protein
VPFVKATKKAQKLRLAITGPAGAGKTFTALTIAKHIGQRIAVIDTERGSASKYAGDVADFDTQVLQSFEAQRYVSAMHEAAKAGYDVLIVDSLSHAWAGKGGILEQVDKRGGKFQAWKEATLIQQRLVDTILTYPGHVIVTMRSKMAYQVATEENGGRRETKVEKLGLAPIQRDDLPYEFDVVLDMDERNNAHVSKTRCPALTGEVIAKPGAEVAAALMAWLDDAASASDAGAAPEPEQKRTGGVPRSSSGQPTPDMVALDQLGTVPSLEVWCGTYAAAYGAMAGDEQRFVAKRIATKAKELRVPLDTVKAWLAPASPEGTPEPPADDAPLPEAPDDGFAGALDQRGDAPDGTWPAGDNPTESELELGAA